MDESIPGIGSDDWRYWVIGKLESIQRGGVTDGDIAAIIGENGSATRIAINQLISAGDQEVIRLLGEAISQQLTSFTASANRYSDSRDGLVLDNAKKYTDDKVANGTPSGVSKEYVDSADDATFTRADTAAGKRDETISTGARNYADSVGRQVLADANAAADIGFAETLRAANAYTDDHTSSGGGVTEQYVDDAVSQGVADAATAAGLADDAVLGSARTYADEAVSGASADVRAYADQQAGQAQTAAEAAAVDGDAATLASAKTYTDTSIDDVATGLSTAIDGKVSAGVEQANNYTDVAIENAGTGSGVSQDYVNQQDTATLTSAKADATQKANNAQTAATNAAALDASTKANAAVATAKAYTDGKVTDTGWYALPFNTDKYSGTINQRFKNGRYELEGAIGLVAGGAIVADSAIATASQKPDRTLAFIVPTVGAGFARVHISNVTGQIDINTVSGTGTQIRFDNVGFLPNV